MHTDSFGIYFTFFFYLKNVGGHVTRRLISAPVPVCARLVFPRCCAAIACVFILRTNDGHNHHHHFQRLVLPTPPHDQRPSIQRPSNWDTAVLCSEDMYAHDSIQLLKNSGIDFQVCPVKRVMCAFGVTFVVDGFCLSPLPLLFAVLYRANIKYCFTWPLLMVDCGHVVSVFLSIPLLIYFVDE